MTSLAPVAIGINTTLLAFADGGNLGLKLLYDVVNGRTTDETILPLLRAIVINNLGRLRESKVLLNQIRYELGLVRVEGYEVGLALTALTVACVLLLPLNVVTDKSNGALNRISGALVGWEM